MLFALDVCVNKKAPPTVCTGALTLPLLRNITLSFLPSPFLNLQTVQAPPL